MTHDEIKAALDAVAAGQSVADAHLPRMVRMIANRLHSARDSFSYGDRRGLSDIKKELRNFNSTTRRWKV